MKKKILITGFEPFGGMQYNASGHWVELAKQKIFNDRIVKGAILPVAFHRSFQHFQEIYDEFLPDVVLLTGLAQNRQTLTVERIGINWMDARIPDNLGQRPRTQKIREHAPDGLFTTVAMEELLAISSKLNISTSAGEYVCNYLLYEVLLYIKLQAHSCRATFFHLPGHEDYKDVFGELDGVVENI